MRAKRSHRNSSAWAPYLLSGGLLVAVVLAGLSVRASYSHRTATRQLLRDYAQLASSRVLESSQREINFYCFYPGFYFIRRWDSPTLPSADPSLATLSRQEKQAMGSIAYFFSFDLASSRFELSPSTVLSERSQAQWGSQLLALFDGAGEALPPYRLVLKSDDAGAPFVAGLERSEEGQALRVVGFRLQEGALARLLKLAATRIEWIPPALAHDAAVDSLLNVSVLDVAGDEFLSLSSPSSEEYEEYVGSSNLGAQLDSLTIRVAIPASAAPRLILGGLPPDNMRIALIMLAMTALFFIGLMRLLRKESDLARLRADFVSGISHEFRTPLAQIRLFAETLRLGRVRNSEESERSITIIDQEARRLTLLVETALHFARSERGTIQSFREQTRVDQLLDEVSEAFTPLARARGSQLQVHSSTDCVAKVDPGAITQLVLNLLDNALKYGPEEQIIRVELRIEDHQLHIAVEDEGPGIPAHEREIVWHRFERLDRDREAGMTGTGIGLAVVADIVAAHDGRATIVDPAHSPHGCRVEIQIPNYESQESST